MSTACADAPSSSAASVNAASPFLSNTPIEHPSCASLRQIAWPMPPAPPVTIAALPSSPRMMASLKRVRQPHAVIDGAHSIELGRTLRPADEMRSSALLYQRIVQRPCGVLSGANHDRVGRYGSV